MIDMESNRLLGWHREGRSTSYRRYFDLIAHCSYFLLYGPRFIDFSASPFSTSITMSSTSQSRSVMPVAIAGNAYMASTRLVRCPSISN